METPHNLGSTARANPGGEIAPDEVFGRDRLIEAFWSTLEVQSIVMVAERRIGKTTVVKKMRSAQPDGVRLVYRDVEGVRTPLEFAEAVARDIEPLLSATTRGAQQLSKLFKGLQGTEIAGVIKFPPELAPHWKSLLEATLGDLLRDESETTYVFVWDELPIMVDKILRSADEETAMDVLDTLRGLRQAHSSLRMIYTGSIGLHHVLGRLKTAAHLNDATNDMRSMEVGELSPADGAHLARALLAGENLKCASDGIAEQIAVSVDYVPFHIHQIVRKLSDAGASVDAKLVKDTVSEALVDAQDPWHLEHFMARLSDRYGEYAALARSTLAILAHSETAISLSEISKLLRSTLQKTPRTSPPVAAVLEGDDEPLGEVLKLLARDHYITPNREKRYRFRFSLIGRWWKLQG